MGHERDLLLLGGVDRRRVHDARVDVLVVADEHGLAAVARGLDDVRVVVVVAELEGLRGGALVLGVECGRARDDGVAPADERLPGPPVGHRECVDRPRDRRDGREPERAAPEGRACLRGGGRGVRAGSTCGDRHGSDAGEPEERAARQRRARDVAEGGVARGVRDGVEARIRTLEVAGDGAPLAGRVAGHGQQGAVERFDGHGSPSSGCAGGRSRRDGPRSAT